MLGTYNPDGTETVFTFSPDIIGYTQTNPHPPPALPTSVGNYNFTNQTCTMYGDDVPCWQPVHAPKAMCLWFAGAAGISTTGALDAAIKIKIGVITKIVGLSVYSAVAQYCNANNGFDLIVTDTPTGG